MTAPTLTLSIGYIIDWAIKIAFLIYIPRKRKPSSAIAWLLLLFLIPGIGLILFIIIGSPKLSKRRRKTQALVDKRIMEALTIKNNQLDSLDEAARDMAEPVANLALSLGKFPAYAGNDVKILPEYNKAIDSIVKEVNRAEEFVHIEYFIIALDEITQPLFDAMERAVQRGVKVRVLFDAMGYRAYPRKKEMKKLLTKIGVDWHMMLPIKLGKKYNRPDLRNHRKIVVVDDRVAYIGSQNLVDRTYHRKDDIYYDELVARIEGPTVRQCAAVFASDWFAETGERLIKLVDPSIRPLPKKAGDTVVQILPSGPNYEQLNNARLFADLIHATKKKLFITNPYFVPNDAILDAVTSAAIRGVDVTILNSEAMDQWMVGHAQRSFYDELLAAGVKIFLYKQPILLHSKHMTIDDDIAVVGSSNMDIRSFELDLECIMIAYDKGVVKDLQKVQKENLKRSEQVSAAVWKKRGLWQDFRDSIARLTSALQ